MKHNSLISANGLLHNPLASTTIKSSVLTTIFKPLLLLLLLVMGSSVVWASTNYFTPGKTLYFHVGGDCKNWGSNQFAALFYYQNNENKAYGYENESYSARQFIGNNSIGSSNRIKCTRINDDYYSVVIPTNGTANIGYVRLIHLNTDDGWCHQAQKKISADSFTGTNNCLAYSAWDDGDPSGFEEYNSGECITSACGGAPAGDTFQGGEVFYMKQNTICKDGNSHDFLKYGRCDFNLYSADGSTFLSKALSAQVIPGTDPVMLKFVVPAEYAGTVWGQVKVKQLETGGAGHNETNKGAIPKDGKNYLINGNTMEWGTYVEPVTPVDPSLQPWSGDSYRDWYLTGDFSNPGVFDAWVQNPSGYKFAADGDNHQKVSITLDPNDASIFHDNSGHKLTRFEIIRQGDWNDPRINKPHFDAESSNCSLQTDWIQPSSNRMSLELTAKSVIEFDIWRWGTAPGSADRKVTVTITPIPQVTVTFMANGETFATQTFDKGGKASIPAGTPARSGYNFNGWDWDFNTTVNENTTINATWVYKAIESVSLSESTHMTWVGNSDFALTPTLAPSDLITKSVAWSSDVESVATVSGGTVHAVSAGSAIITCTITDMNDNVRSASCEVTVAACQMIVNNLYSMTVTDYNTSTGSSATLSDLWNESSDNDGPATLEKVKIEYKDNNGNNQAPIAVDADHRVKAISGLSDGSDYWYRIPTGETIINGSHTYDVYYLKNVKTGEFIYVDKSTEYGHNGDYWHYWATRTSAANAETDIYKWFTAVNYNQGDHRNVIVCKDGFNNTYSGDGARTNIGLYRTDVNPSTEWSDPLIKCGQKVMNGYQNAHTGMVPSVTSENIPNPTYKVSLMNGSYYRMNTDATVRANLNAALVSGAVITVRLYADAATSVQLTKANGTLIETIDLSADAEREYSYTVVSNSALLGENAFVIKAADNHAGIASIVVSRTYAASPSDPALEWETDLSGGVTQSVLSGTFQHIASSTVSLGAIHYISSDETVATVAANGTVTPLSAGNTTITATIEAEGCYAEAYITYNVTLTEASLQEAIDATPGGGTLTLTHDYNDNAEINKAITINGDGHTIGDLKIEQSGDLTLSSGLTVRDFTICAKAGNTTTPAASGQVRNAANLTCNRNAYFLYTVDPSGQVQFGWYDFSVPFPVQVMSGIKGIQDNVLNEDFVNERDYAIMEYLGERKAQGQYPYQKFRGVMQPNQLYSITLDSRYNYNTVRFQKTADGALVTGNNVTLHAYAGGGVYTNLNGVGNGTLHHADAGISGDYVQVYQSGDKTFLTVDKTQYSFVVGTAFMVQETGTMTLNQATHGQLLAPARQASAPATAIQIAREGQPFSDQLFISASETGGQAYTPGTDLAKAGDLGSANVPQIWTNAYNNPLCVHEAQLINGEASYNLSIYAPAADTYTLTSQNIPADYSLYLTQNGTMLTELSGTYTFDLSKGITTEYGLLLVETYKTPTGMEESMSQESRVKSQKILHNGVLYILHNGKIYNAQGGLMK